MMHANPEPWQFPAPIGRWDEGVPLGNGQLGCLIWGAEGTLRFALDRGDLWDATPAPGRFDPRFRYDELVRLARARDAEGVRRVFDDLYAHPTPTKLPAGALELRGLGPYTARLDLARAEAVIDLADGGGAVRCFVHAERPFGMICAQGAASHLPLVACMPDFAGQTPEEADAPRNSVSPGALRVLGYPPCRAVRMGEASGWVQPVGQGCYALLYASRVVGSDALHAFAVCRLPEGDQDAPLRQTALALTEALEAGYDAAMEAHAAWWARYWARSAIDLPDAAFVRHWHMANYLLGSCSRKGGLPAPLQGLWIADEGKLPPWKGDYHNDLNTQLTYSHYLVANHVPEGECFLDYLWALRPAAASHARDFFGLDGACLPGVMDVAGGALGGWPMYALSPTNHIWLCQLFYRHWRVTADAAFLRQRALPTLQSAALFFEQLLQAGADGMLSLPVSSSPEVHDDTAASWLTPNSNYDLALLHFLFEKTAELERDAGVGNGERWRALRKRLPELAVDGDGALLLAPGEALTQSHRHFSHTMAVWPLALWDADAPERRAAIQATVQRLLALGTEQWVGYTFAWMGLLLALLGDGDGAHRHLSLLFDHFYSPNGFHLNGDYKRAGVSGFHYRPFTLEANFFAAEVLQTMLLQSGPGFIKLFPALPGAWQGAQVGFEGFLADGGLQVSATLHPDGQLSLTLAARQDIRVTLKNIENPQTRDEPVVATLRAGEMRRLQGLRLRSSLSNFR